MSTVLDHIVVVANTLAEGSHFVERALGVAPRPGGAHPRMGTHNLLLSLGACYLEVMAIDPQAAPPDRPRWFGLDTLRPGDPPRLAAWVARTDDIQAASAAAGGALGEVQAMTRGALLWLITVPADGALPLGGAAPALIQWQVAEHPARSLPESGCSLVELEVFHPAPAEVRAVYAAIGLQDAPRVQLAPTGQPLLVAHVRTPQGLRTLAAA